MLTYQICSKNDFSQDESCPICLDPFIEGGSVVAHAWEGRNIHPVHEKCAKVMAETTGCIENKCPACRVNIDLSSLFSNEELNTIESRFSKREMQGSAQRIFLGTGVKVAAITGATTIFGLAVFALTQQIEMATTAIKAMGMASSISAVFFGVEAVAKKGWGHNTVRAIALGGLSGCTAGIIISNIAPFGENEWTKNFVLTSLISVLAARV